MRLLGRHTAKIAFAFSAGLLLASCAQPIAPGTNSSASSLSGGVVEVDPTITPDQIQTALRRVKGLMLDRPFLTRTEQGITTLEQYKSTIATYLDDPAAPGAIQRLWRQVLQLEGTEAITTFNNGVNAELMLDNDEPSSLIAYIFKNGEDFRKVLTADFCVTNVESGLNRKADCSSQGRFNKTSTNTNDPNQFFTMTTPIELRAGAISTQAYLRKYAGARDFRRGAKAHEFFLCSNYPDPEEQAGWTAQNAQLHPFYFTPAGGDQDCQSCHQSLNKSRAFFSGFGMLGELQMGQAAQRVSDMALVNVDARRINDVEAATINLPNYVSLYGRQRTDPFEGTPTNYHGTNLTQSNQNPGRAGNPSYVKLSDYGSILANSPRFTACTAQRLYNFAMGNTQSFLNRLPPRLASSLPDKVASSNYNLKSILLEIFSTTEFLNR